MNDQTFSPCVPLELSAEALEELVEKAKDFALMHGESDTGERESVRDR